MPGSNDSGHAQIRGERRNGGRARTLRAGRHRRLRLGPADLCPPFHDNRKPTDALLAESPGKRDIAFYVADPHVLLAMEPQNIFPRSFAHLPPVARSLQGSGGCGLAATSIRLLNSRADARPCAASTSRGR